MLTNRLRALEKPQLMRHFLALSREDRRFRFGGFVCDASIERYVDALDATRDAIFGALENRELVGVAHVPIEGGRAELGVSVLPEHRRQGIGSALVSRAANHARAEGVAALCMICLAENAAMLRIARSLGMRVVRHGASAEALLELSDYAAAGCASLRR